MANFWGAAGRPVTLITLRARLRATSIGCIRSVRRIAVESAGKISGLRSLAQNTLGCGFLRRAITDSHPELVVKFLDESNVRALACTLDLKIPS